MASGSKPPFAFFVETCQEQQDYLQQIWRSNNCMEEQVDISELCKLTKQRWQNLTHERRKAYLKVINVDGEKCGENEEQKKPSFPVEQSRASTIFVPASKVGATPGGKKKKDQLAPKRTKSAYTFYLIEEGKCVREANPSWKLGEVTKELGRRWTGMNTPERKKYCVMAEKDRQRYDEEMKLFATQCREREREENLEERKLLIDEHNVSLTNKQMEDKMDMQDNEAKESNLIECRERLRSVIEFGGLKQKIDQSEIGSVACSPEDKDVIKVEDNQKMDVEENKKNDVEQVGKLEQEKMALKWEEKMVYGFKLKDNGFKFKENALKVFIAKETLLADEAETKSCLDFVMKHYGVVISYEDIQNHKLKVGKDNTEGIDLNINDKMAHDFKRWKMAHDLREESLQKIAEDKLRGQPLEIESFEDFVARHNKSADSAKKIENPDMEESNPNDFKFWKTEYNLKDNSLQNVIVKEDSFVDQLEMDSVVDLIAKDIKMVESSKVILNDELKIEEVNMDMGGIQNNKAEGYISIQEKSEVKDKNVCDFKTEKITLSEESNENFHTKENPMADPIESESFLYFVSKHNNMVGDVSKHNNMIGDVSKHNNMVGDVSEHNNMVGDVSEHNNMIGDVSEHNNMIGDVSKHNNMVGDVSEHNNMIGEVSKHNNLVGDVSEHNNMIEDVSKHNNMVGSPKIIPSDELGIGYNHNNMVGSSCKQLGSNVSNHNNMVDSPNMVPSDTLGIEKKNWTGIEDREGAECISNVEGSDSSSWERSGEINTNIAATCLPIKGNLDVIDTEHDALGENIIEETPTEDIKEKIVINKNEDINLEENDKVIKNEQHGKANMDTGAVENNETLGFNSIDKDPTLNEKIEYDFKIKNTSYESKDVIAKENSNADQVETEPIMELGVKDHKFVTNSELVIGVMDGEPKYRNGELNCKDGANEDLKCKVEVSNNEVQSNTGIMGIENVVHNTTEKTGNDDMKEHNECDI